MEIGQTLKSFNLTGRPYGLAIDSDGIIWYAVRSGSHGVGRLHPENGETNWYGSGPYGLAIDPFGYVWVASMGKAASSDWIRIPAVGGTLNLGWGGTRGVHVSVKHGGDGQIVESRVYTAHSGTGRISVLDAFTKQKLGAINLGNSGHCPVGVAIDSTNHIWSVNQCTSTASKVDPDNWNVEFTKSVGQNPYTYSDMTGYALKNNYGAGWGVPNQNRGLEGCSNRLGSRDYRRHNAWQRSDMVGRLLPIWKHRGSAGERGLARSKGTLPSRQLPT